MEDFETLKQQLIELSLLKSALSVLDWDTQVYMPKGGSVLRSQTIAHLTSLIHQQFISKEFEKNILAVKKLSVDKKLDPTQEVIFKEVFREFEKEKKLPAEFVKELAQITSEGHHIWMDARAKSDFKHFAPTLEKIVEMKRKQAEYWGYTDSPYDALLDIFEPNMTSRELEQIFTPLKEFLISFIQKINTSKVKINSKKITGNFPIEKQKEFLDFTS
jgi:carboxypeptidase Taq